MGYDFVGVIVSRICFIIIVKLVVVVVTVEDAVVEVFQQITRQRWFGEFDHDVARV